MPKEQDGYGFTVILDGESMKPGADSSSKAKTTSSSVDQAAAPSVSAGGSLSDDEILRGIRFVETSAGRASGGSTGGYDEFRSDTGVFGAYQITRSVWQNKIKSRFGWDFNDWFDPSGDAQKKTQVRMRQDRIAKEMLLPEYKSGVAGMKLYDTPIGQHVPRGLLEIASQLGLGNLKEFLVSGRDNTAFSKMQNGQILGYLETAAKAVGKPLGRDFYEALNNLGGVKTKFTRGVT